MSATLLKRLATLVDVQPEFEKRLRSTLWLGAS